MSNTNKYESGIKKQGRLHEDAALRKIGGDAVNLNDLEKSKAPEVFENAHGVIVPGGFGHRGAQYPTFDLSSSTEFTSVKSHISQPGQLTEQDINLYKADFSKMLGNNRAYANGLSPLQQDAQNIVMLEKNGIPIPNELKGASQEKVVDYLQNETIMRIPDDHVEKMRETIMADARQIPEKYCLPEDPSEDQIAALGNRLQGTGLTTSETAELMKSSDMSQSQSSPIQSEMELDSSKTEEKSDENEQEIQTNEHESEQDYFPGHGL